MRIVSLLPSATEIAAALGLSDQLVAVSHECDYPPEAVAAKPRITSSLLNADLDPARIDAAVAEAVRRGEALYRIDGELLAELSPDLVLTQGLCDVCAVPDDQVGETLKLLPDVAPDLRTVTLSGGSVAGILRDVRLVAEAADVDERAETVVEAMTERWEQVRRLAPAGRLGVAVLEWPDPAFTAGHWVPEQVEVAGGVDVLGKPGAESRRVGWEEVAAAEPEVIVSAACGYGVEHNVGYARELAQRPELAAIPAVAAGQVWAVDANAYFSRPAPRVVEGAEILAAILSGRDPGPTRARRAG